MGDREREQIAEAGFAALREAIREGARIQVSKDGRDYPRQASGEALVSYVGTEYIVPEPRTRSEDVEPKFMVMISIERI